MWHAIIVNAVYLNIHLSSSFGCEFLKLVNTLLEKNFLKNIKFRVAIIAWIATYVLQGE